MSEITCFDISEPVLHISSGKFSAGSNWKHKHMYHDGNFEIIIVIQGTLYLQVDDERYVINESEVFSLPPFHHIRGFKESPKNSQYFWFHFFPKPNGLKIKDTTSMSENDIIGLFTNNQAALPLQFKMNSVDRAFMLANQVLDVAKNNYFADISIDYLLTSLLIELSEDYYQTLSGATVTEDEARINGIKEWIRSNLSEKLRVNEVADHFELNPHYLVRIFKEQTGMTVIQYISNLKLRDAQELLLRTNLPIKQIASMAFYPDEKRFMKVFKEQLQLTPTEFRNAYTRKFLDSSSFDPEVTITKNTKNYRERFNH